MQGQGKTTNEGRQPAFVLFRLLLLSHNVRGYFFRNFVSQLTSHWYLEIGHGEEYSYHWNQQMLQIRASFTQVPVYSWASHTCSWSKLCSFSLPNIHPLCHLLGLVLPWQRGRGAGGPPGQGVQVSGTRRGYGSWEDLDWGEEQGPSSLGLGRATEGNTSNPSPQSSASDWMGENTSIPHPPA